MPAALLCIPLVPVLCKLYSDYIAKGIRSTGSLLLAAAPALQGRGGGSLAKSSRWLKTAAGSIKVLAALSGGARYGRQNWACQGGGSYVCTAWHMCLGSCGTCAARNRCASRAAAVCRRRGQASGAGSQAAACGAASLLGSAPGGPKLGGHQKVVGGESEEVLRAGAGAGRCRQDGQRCAGGGSTVAASTRCGLCLSLRQALRGPTGRPARPAARQAPRLPPAARCW